MAEFTGNGNGNGERAEGRKRRSTAVARWIVLCETRLGWHVVAMVTGQNDARKRGKTLARK